MNSKLIATTHDGDIRIWDPRVSSVMEHAYTLNDLPVKEHEFTSYFRIYEGTV